MKLRDIFFVFTLLATIILPQAVVADDSIPDRLLPEGLFTPSNQGKLVLVGFTDQHIDRISMTTSMNPYRKRGPYSGSTWSKRISDNIAEDYHLQEISAWPLTELGIHCIVYRVSESSSLDELVERLQGDERLEIVQKINMFQVEANPYSDPYSGLQSNIQLIHLDKLHSKVTGRDIKVALIDTGVDLDHPDLRGQIVASKNYAKAISAEFSEDIHGTAVAGVIAARTNNATGIVGIAPDSRLVAFKACWPLSAGSIEAACNSFTLALAINMAIKWDVNILNLSLTGPKDPLLTSLIKTAISKGIFVVSADSGTEDPDKCFPGCMDDVIAVRISSNDSKELIASKRSVVAPGQDILTTVPHGTYDFISGSSVAAAHISGLIALLLEQKPELTSADARAILQNTPFNELHKLVP